jgi:dihydrofolate synthase/folylpolyglutamate synthase
LSDHLRAHDAALARLQALHPKLIDLSLDRMLRLCAALDRPQDRLPPVIHVAGTNGKGSTVAYLRAMAEAAGLKVHVFTSPHLVRFAERIRLAGTLITDDHLADVLDRVERPMPACRSPSSRSPRPPPWSPSPRRRPICASSRSAWAESWTPPMS